MQIRKREAKCKQKAKQLNWCRSISNKKWYEDKTNDWSKVMLNWNKTTDEIWTTFLEEEECQISSTITEEEELSCIYKNYIYQGKN